MPCTCMSMACLCLIYCVSVSGLVACSSSGSGAPTNSGRSVEGGAGCSTFKAEAPPAKMLDRASTL